MRCLKRNKRRIWYCLYKQTDTVTDTYGNEVGSHVVYEQPVEMWANVSQATGRNSFEQFGSSQNYDKVIVTEDMDCPIDENTVLIVDNTPPAPPVPPEPDEDEEQDEQSETPEQPAQPEEDPYVPPNYDYIVVRVSKSLNNISIAIRKVDVS